MIGNLQQRSLLPTEQGTRIGTEVYILGNSDRWDSEIQIEGKLVYMVVKGDLYHLFLCPNRATISLLVWFEVGKRILTGTPEESRALTGRLPTERPAPTSPTLPLKYT